MSVLAWRSFVTPPGRQHAVVHDGVDPAVEEPGGDRNDLARESRNLLLRIFFRQAFWFGQIFGKRIRQAHAEMPNRQGELVESQIDRVNPFSGYQLEGAGKGSRRPRH